MDEIKNKVNINVDISLDEERDITNMMIKAYNECPAAKKYLKELNVPEETIIDNIAKVYDMVLDINACKNCPGIENCSKENPRVVTKITYNYGYLDRTLQPCKKMMNRYSLLGSYKMCDFPQEWLDYEMKTMDQTANRKKVFRALADYMGDRSDRWIYIGGAASSGRSFTAAILSIELAKREKGPIAFINSVNRFKELSDYSYSNKKAFDKTMDLYTSVPVLVIDDFGNEYKNDFVREGILLQILIKRSSKKLFTVFTSDYSMEEISILYKTSRTNSADITSRKIYEILQKECKEEFILSDLSIY